MPPQLAAEAAAARPATRQPELGFDVIKQYTGQLQVDRRVVVNTPGQVLSARPRQAAQAEASSGTEAAEATIYEADGFTANMAEAAAAAVADAEAATS